MEQHPSRSYESRWVLASHGRRVLGLLILGSALLAAIPWAAPDTDARDRDPVVYPEILISAEELLGHVPANPSGEKYPEYPEGTWRFLDARPANRYGWGHIPGAIRFDPSDHRGRLDPEKLRRRFNSVEFGLSDLDTVVCYSDRDSPAAAGELFWILEAAGHPAVRVLNGGFEAWTTARGAIETERRAPVSRPFSAEPDTSLIANVDYVLEHFGRKGYTVLDWRSPEEWAKGHIPHSLPFPLETLVGEDGLLLTGQEMRARFAAWGPRDRDYVDLDDEVIVLGGARHGHQPIDPYIAARLAGIDRVRVYREGYHGWWLRQADVPVTRLVGISEVRTHLRKQWGNRFRETDLPPADCILLDLRGRRDYDIGHIPGAVQLAPHRFEEEFEALIAEYWPGVDRNTVPVVAYCYGPTCIRSRFGTTFAAQHGFKNLEWYKDGVQGWRQAGEKLVTDRRRR